MKSRPWMASIMVIVGAIICEAMVEDLPPGKNPDLVAKVMRGELKRARASWWGFDATDATSTLQAAIKSRVPELIIDHMGMPWMVTPLDGVSDQTLRLESGVVLMAKEGAFKDTNDALFTFSSCTNVVITGSNGSTLRMRRNDYHDKTKYKWSEWRHALKILSSVNVRIENLTVAESGGDGLYLGIDWRQHNNCNPCRNIVVRNCVFDKNYRQGISVISVNGLRIEDTVMQNTWGTPPAAGIDFEPNRPQEEIVDCVMRNCRSDNNQGSGYDLIMANFNATTKPLDIRLENCHSKGNRNSIVYTGQWDFKSPNILSYARGRIDIINCNFEDAEGCSAVISGKPKESVFLTFRTCRFSRAKCPVGSPDIQLGTTSRCRWWPPVDGLRLEDCTIEQSAVHPWISSCNCKVRTRSVENVSGAVTVVNSSETKRIELNDGWREQTFGKCIPLPEFKATAFDPHCANVTDRDLGKRTRLSPIQVRGNVRYVFHAPKAGKVNFAGRFIRIGTTPVGNEIVARKLQSADKDLIGKVKMQNDGKRQEFSFMIPTDGFYSMSIPTGQYHAYQLLESDVAIAIDATDEGIFRVFHAVGDLWLNASEGETFGVFASGSDSCERISIEVFDPTGKSVWVNQSVYDWDGTLIDNGIGGLWHIRLGTPQNGVHEDGKIELAGKVAHIFLSDRRFWSSANTKAGMEK